MPVDRTTEFDKEITDEAERLFLHITKYVPENLHSGNGKRLLRMLKEFLENFRDDILDSVGP